MVHYKVQNVGKFIQSSRDRIFCPCPTGKQYVLFMASPPDLDQPIRGKDVRTDCVCGFHLKDLAFGAETE